MVSSAAVQTGLLFAGLALDACTGIERSIVARPCVPVQAEVDSALSVHSRHTQQLMAIPGVVGTAVGVTPDCRSAITVFTKVAGVTGLPDSLEGIPVQMQVTGDFTAQ